MRQRRDDAALSFDRMLEVLASRPRRHVLLTLVDRSRYDERELVAELGRDGENGPSRIRLHHAELPRLESAGLVDWDEATGVITRGPAFASIRPLLEVLLRHGDDLPEDWRPSRRDGVDD